MKSVRNFLLICSIVALFPGCYTELATVERNDRDYVYDTDTTYEDGTATINNHYYLDDDYRRSRLRVSFNYYYPENTSWIGGYYNSYFNDPYWGMRPFSWTYDPWYGYYPTWGCPPYYDPWHPYYPVVYYPTYYPSSVYVSGQPATPPRIRTDGSTRDGNGTDIRTRPIDPLPETQITTIRTGRGNEKDVIPVQEPIRKRGNEVSWWERNKSEQPREAKPIDRPREVRPQSVPEKQSRIGEEAVPVEKPREVRRPTYTPSPKPSTPSDESRPVERPRESRRPTYTPSPKSSTPNNEARPVERPRETRQQSYSPPPQQSAPSVHSAPAQSPSRGSSSGTSSGGERKRD